MRTQNRAFTLIELLVVTAIIAILTALLLPTIARTKETGRSAVCLQCLHQIGIGLQVYVQDNDNLLPTMYDRSTNDTFKPAINTVLQLGNTNVFRCPSDSKRLFEVTGSSYSWNSVLNGQNADRLRLLTNVYPLHQIPVVYDKEKFHLARGNKRAINFLYADGHIKNLMELQTPQ